MPVNSYYKPYNGDNAPEYNVNGDSGNGRQGSYSPGAIQNRATQKPQRSGNPYADILNFIQKPQPPRVGTAASNSYVGDVPNTGSNNPTGGGAPSSDPFNTTGGFVPAPIAGLPQTPDPLNNGGGGFTPAPTQPPLREGTGPGTNPPGAGQGQQPASTQPPGQTFTPGSGTPVNTTLPPAPVFVNGQAAPPTPVTPQPPQVPAPSMPAAPQNPQAPDVTPPPERPDPTNWREVTMPNVPDLSGYGAILGQLFRPQFQQEQQDLTGQLRGLGALTGDTNATGYAEIEGREMNRLRGQQSAFLGDKTHEAYQNALDRALKQYETDSESNLGRYRIDADKFAAQIAADTQRFGISTNAQMEKYLADQRAELEKYGIDVNALMDRYKADLQSKGVIYTADRQFDAAVMDNAIRQYIADQQYNLGVGQLGLEQYKWDNPSFNAILAAYLGMSPEQLALAGIGGIVWPNQIYSRP